ncbi:MAG: hypothetical protein HRT36_02380, partial [Alphaproteobacteria bacterium]|nr:hypothetical protein [Alphaproteobacteria bacterium]
LLEAIHHQVPERAELAASVVRLQPKVQRIAKPVSIAPANDEPIRIKDAEWLEYTIQDQNIDQDISDCLYET